MLNPPIAIRSSEPCLSQKYSVFIPDEKHNLPQIPLLLGSNLRARLPIRQTLWG